jgi:hypothetical protein
MKLLLPSTVELSTLKKAKLHAAVEEARNIVREAEQAATTDLSGNISFEFKTSVPRDVLTEFERAQSAAFISRYEHLPELNELRFVAREGQVFLQSVAEVRHTFNEYRPMFMNEKDSSHYSRVHNTVHQKLCNPDSSLDLKISALHDTKGDVSRQFAAFLKDEVKGIRKVVQLSDFDYIYNGILQHSDQRFTERFWGDYTSGELNYLYLKNLCLLPFLKSSLRWHYTILSALTFPKFGPL